MKRARAKNITVVCIVQFVVDVALINVIFVIALFVIVLVVLVVGVLAGVLVLVVVIMVGVIVVAVVVFLVAIVVVTVVLVLSSAGIYRLRGRRQRPHRRCYPHHDSSCWSRSLRRHRRRRPRRSRRRYCCFSFGASCFLFVIHVFSCYRRNHQSTRRDRHIHCFPSSGCRRTGPS